MPLAPLRRLSSLSTRPVPVVLAIVACSIAVVLATALVQVWRTPAPSSPTGRDRSDPAVRLVVPEPYPDPGSPLQRFDSALTLAPRTGHSIRDVFRFYELPVDLSASAASSPPAVAGPTSPEEASPQPSIPVRYAGRIGHTAVLVADDRVWVVNSGGIAGSPQRWKVIAIESGAVTIEDLASGSVDVLALPARPYTRDH